MDGNAYDRLNELQIDAIREATSIGAGNAATALSSVIDKRVAIEVPKVSILDFNDALQILGGPETIVSGIMVKLSGEINGIMLYIQQLDFINLILGSVLQQDVKDYNELTEMESSALIEIGNIIICSYMNAISSLANIDISLSVPSMCVNMAGAVLSVPMVEYGYETDKMMTLEGSFVCDGYRVQSKLLLVPDVASLKYLLRKLGVESE